MASYAWTRDPVSPEGKGWTLIEYRSVQDILADAAPQENAQNDVSHQRFDRMAKLAQEFLHGKEAAERKMRELNHDMQMLRVLAVLGWVAAVAGLIVTGVPV